MVDERTSGSFCRRVEVRRKKEGKRAAAAKAQARARKYEQEVIGRRPGSVVLLAGLVAQLNTIRNLASSQQLK